MAPAFFQQLNRLIQSIPRTPQAFRLIPPIIEDYLNYYAINFVAEGDASTYQIWQSTLHSYRIVEHRWQATASNGKTLIVLHGYFDHTALFGKLIRWALQEGYTVHSFDLPGHGLSSGEPAAIEHFNEYGNILSSIINREAYQYYELVGQSTGGAVILNCLLNRDRQTPLNYWPRKIILLAPLIRIRYWPVLRWFYYLLKPFLTYISRSFRSSSHDEAFNLFIKERDPLQCKKIPLNWIGAMDLWVKQIKRLPQLDRDKTVDSIVIQGSKDNTVDWRYNYQVIRNCLPQTQIYMISNAWHHLVNESDDYWSSVVLHLNLNKSVES